MDRSICHEKIAIIGAGIGGLALAIGLARRNVDYTIYEAGPQFSAVGAGIALGPNSLRAMALIDPILRELYGEISTGNRSAEKVHVFADFMLAEPGFGVNRGWEGAPVGSKDFTKSGAHRKDLLEIMTQLFPTKNVRFGKRAVEVKQVDQKVAILFADGEEVEVDAVIGCDGAKGVTRRAVLAAAYPEHVTARYSGRYVYRAVIPPTEAQKALGDYAYDGKMFLGPGHYFALYQMSGGRLNLVAARQKNNQWTHDQWTQEVTREEMLADFDSCDPRLIELLGVSEPSILLWLEAEMFSLKVSQSYKMGPFPPSRHSNVLQGAYCASRRRCSCLHASPRFWCWAVPRGRASPLAPPGHGN
jgi:salicylate hydroxylase